MSGKASFRIVMLTNGNEHGIKILERLMDMGIILDAVVFETKSRISDHVFNTNEWYAIRLVKAIRRWGLSLCRSNQIERHLAKYTRVVRAGSLNGGRLTNSLRKLNPDFIVLGGIGIISQDIINTARYGVLNAHPGLLPWIRGSGVVARAIEKGIPIGGTCHFVDSMIDTGRIIERRLLSIDKQYSLSELESRAGDLVVEMMVDIVRKITVDATIPESREQKGRFPICKRVEPNERVHLNSLVQTGKPHQMFAEWLEHCTDSEKKILKNDIEVTLS